jgi:hypothetical protein
VGYHIHGRTNWEITYQKGVSLQRVVPLSTDDDSGDDSASDGEKASRLGKTLTAFVIPSRDSFSLSESLMTKTYCEAPQKASDWYT